ncbi:MAG: TonB-dependent receptor [Nitrospiraceae bacterium]
MIKLVSKCSIPTLLLLLAITLTWGQVQAQTIGGSISGTVKDPSGAVVPGADVTIKNVDTGLERQLQTDKRGYYRASGLTLGSYEVRVEAEGFQTGVRTGISLTVERGAVVNITLQVGAREEEVIVTGEAPFVDTTSATMGELVGEEKVRALPLNLRDITQLTLLQPAVIQSRGSTRDINVGFGMKVSVAGSRPNQNLFLMDGTDANDALNNTPAGAPGALTGVETIKEFRVLTNTMSAEYGRVAGGVFNIVTKSGTNDVHGSVFWFHRNDNFDARNFFDAELPEFRRNQFGFTLGGPIVQDKTHFFGSYEGLREEKGITQDAFVPSMTIRNALPGTDITFPPRPGRFDPTDPLGDLRIITLSPNVSPILNLYPFPTGPEIIDPDSGLTTHVAEFSGIIDRFANEDFLTVRIDHRFSDSDNLFGRYLFTDSEFLLPVLFPDFPNLDVNRRQIFTLGETHVFSPTVLNEFRFGINRSTPAELVPDPPSNYQLLQGQVLGSIRVRSRRGISALTEVGTDRTNPKLFFNNTFQFSDNLSINRGRHSFKLGVLAERFQFNGDSQSRTRGRLEFRSLIQLVDDDPRRIEGASATSDFARGYRQSLFGFYFQDDIRITPRFTLFAGIRWEFVTTPTEHHGRVSNITEIGTATSQIIVDDQRFADPTADPPIQCCRPLFDPEERQLAPRLGLAWDIFGTGKTVLRSGFGLFYEQPLFHVYRNPIFRTLPLVERKRVNADDWPVPDTVAGFPLPTSIFASGGGGQDTELFQFDLSPTYVMQYNLNLQQDIGWNTIVSLAYVGSRGVNLFGQGDTNLVLPCGDPSVLALQCPAPGQDFPTFEADGTPIDVGDAGDFLRNPDFGRIRTIFQGFNSWYNAATVGFVKHPSHGLSFQGSYTFSKCLDERSGSGGRQEQRFGQARAFDPFNRSLDKARCDFDVKHNFVGNHVYDLPFGPGKTFGSDLTGAAARIVEGWQLGGILTLASGVPFNPFIGGDPDFDGSDDGVSRPNLVGDPNSGTCGPNGPPVGTPDCWFNPEAFDPTLPGFRGNLGRNFLTGPDLASYDFSLVKKTNINERVYVEFRAEFFNIFNRANFNPPVNTDDGAQIFSEDDMPGDPPDFTGAAITARSITSTTSREIQFAIRIVF